MGNKIQFQTVIYLIFTLTVSLVMMSCTYDLLELAGNKCNVLSNRRNINGYYDFNGRIYNIEWYGSGYYSPLPINITYVTGKVAGGIHFSGNSCLELLSFHDPFNYDNSPWRSFGFWLRLTSPITNTTGHTCIFGADESPSIYNEYKSLHLGEWNSNVTNEMISLAAGMTLANDIFYWTWTSAGMSTLSTTWHYYFFVWDTAAQSYRFYFDGQDKGLAQVFGSPTLLHATGVDVGRYNGTYLDGELDEFGSWKIDLTAEQIATLYNSGAGKAYPFN